VYTYEINPEFQAVAKKNIERLGFGDFVDFRVGDAREGFGVTDMDAGVLDVGDPWDVVPSMRESLKPSAPMVAITPTTNQAERLVQKMKEEGFAAIESLEIMLRHLEARVGMTRPSNIMIGHTAYLIFGRTTTGSPEPLSEVVAPEVARSDAEETFAPPSEERMDPGSLTGEADDSKAEVL
jgi:tRNA (adenine57-N1/adenine58-N1)-methyltransferase